MLTDNRFNIWHLNLRPWMLHDFELSVHLAPAGENCNHGEEKEDVAPFSTVEVDIVSKLNCKDNEYNEEETQPREKEKSLPGPQPMVSKTVTKRGD